MKRLLIVLMLYVFVISVNGQTVSVEEAECNVLEFLGSRTDGNCVKDNGASVRTLELAYTATDTEGNADYYVFNTDGGGFVVAGGDEVAEQILAYSDKGSFAESSISENFHYWLDEYQRQIAYAKAHKDRIGGYVRGSEGRVSFAPFIQTKWNQLSPYNMYCPKVRGETTYTGCVATAMAQVMKYYSWPEKGSGFHEYYDEVSKQTLSADFSAHTYDWTKMPNKVADFKTNEQKQAVARLMSDCGISVEMQYSADGSGAWSENITYAMVNFFGYDKGAKQIKRDYTSAKEWDAVIYNEIVSQRPVIFSGADYSGSLGHCFLCDGYYSSTNKYHFNWGWGSDDDCYCSLAAVQIDKDYDFSYLQDIVIGIQTPKEDTRTSVYMLAYYGGMDLSVKEKDGFTTYTVMFTYTDWKERDVATVIYNHTYRDVDVLFAMKYTNVESGESYITSAKNVEDNKISFKGLYPVVDSNSPDGVKSVTVKDAILPDMPAGKYNVTLVAKDYLDKDDDDINLWTEVCTIDDFKNYVTRDYVPTSITAVADDGDRSSLQYDMSGRIATQSSSGIIIQQGRKYVR